MTLTGLQQWQDYGWAILIGLAIGVVSLLSPLLALGLMLAAIFALSALRRPMLIPYTAIANASFLVGMQRGQLIPLFIPNEPILLGLLGLAFIVVMTRGSTVRYRGEILLALGVFVIGTSFLPLMAYFGRRFLLGTADLFSLLAPAQYLITFWIFSQIPRNDAERHRIVQFMLLCASVVAVIGLMQAANIPVVTGLLRQWYPSPHESAALSLGRVTSLLGAWNSLGNYLMIVLLLIVATQSYPRSRLATANTLAALILCAMCLLASGSYASLFGLGFGVMVIKVFFDRRGLKALLVLGFLLTITSAFLLQDQIAERLNYQFRDSGIIPQTLAYRFTVWQNIFFPILERNLVWGVSPTLTGRVTWEWAESHYLYLLFRSGLISLLAHLAFVALMLRWALRYIRAGSELARMLAIALLTIMISLTIMGFTNEVFTSSGAIDFMWMIIGLVAGSQLREKEPALYAVHPLRA
jgi:hypothetical protein